eukprot:gene4231-3014_t
MAVGTLGAIATGASIPIFNVLFGQIMDELNENPDSFGYGVNQLCIEFCIVAAANLLSGFCQVYCWSATGERQTQKFRERYVHSVLSQEIGCELSTKLAEMIGKVQDGTGRKVGDLIQYVTQFVAALGVAFYLNWKLSLVLLAAIPIIGAAGAFMIMAITSAQQQALEQYAGAGGLASQALNAIRTVTALNMQPGIVSRYRHFLYEAMLIFINAEPYDYLLMFMGTFGGIVTGASIPIFNVLFGQILDELNGDPDAFDKGISQLCINFVIVAAANLLSGFCQVYCWSATGERQTQKFRERYVNSVLSQEIGWFDTCGASELSTKL